MTPLQKIQKDRAYFKFIISGIPKPINQASLTLEESIFWKEILKIRQYLLDMHEDNSREFGLKVPKIRCWCGKEGKYQADYETLHNDKLVCKKHITFDLI